MPVAITNRFVEQQTQAWQKAQAFQSLTASFLCNRAAAAVAESQRQRSAGVSLRLEARELRWRLAETRRAALALVERPTQSVPHLRAAATPVPASDYSLPPLPAVKTASVLPEHPVARPGRPQSLWAAYAAHPSERLREQLIEQNRPLALSILKRMGHGADEDLQQVALLGLVNAVNRFDPAHGNQFATFATPTIVGEVKRYLRDHSRSIRPPRSVHDLNTSMLARVPELTNELGRSPTMAELASALGVEPEQVAEAMGMEDFCHPVSFDGLQSGTESDDLPALGEMFGAEDPEFARIEERLAWEDLLDTLEAPLKRVIQLRFLDDMTQREVARRMGVSQMQVSRLERRAVTRVREAAAGTPMGEVIRHAG